MHTPDLVGAGSLTASLRAQAELTECTHPHAHLTRIHVARADPPPAHTYAFTTAHTPDLMGI